MWGFTANMLSWRTFGKISAREIRLKGKRDEASKTSTWPIVTCKCSIFVFTPIPPPSPLHRTCLPYPSIRPLCFFPWQASLLRIRDDISARNIYFTPIASWNLRAKHTQLYSFAKLRSNENLLYKLRTCNEFNNPIRKLRRKDWVDPNVKFFPVPKKNFKKKKGTMCRI